jgi:hypothetical protein
MTEWRDALREMRPAVPFDNDKRQAVKVILKDGRIANDLFAQRVAIHAGQEGMDEAAARKRATQDMTELARRFGGK